MTGSLMVPNVGLGDIRVTFNQHNPEETARAIRMLLDMQKRGYAILVQLEDGTYTRALSIDAEHASYVVMDDPAPVDAEATTDDISEPAPRLKKDGTPAKKPGRKRVPIETSNAVGVARSAGG